MTRLGLQGRLWQVYGLLLGEARLMHVIHVFVRFILKYTSSSIRCCGWEEHSKKDLPLVEDGNEGSLSTGMSPGSNTRTEVIAALTRMAEVISMETAMRVAMVTAKVEVKWGI
jgi:hypothetical protein